MKKILVLILCIFSFLYAQSTNWEERMVILEDFLGKKLDQLQQIIENQNKTIESLREEIQTQNKLIKELQLRHEITTKETTQETVKQEPVIAETEEIEENKISLQEDNAIQRMKTIIGLVHSKNANADDTLISLLEDKDEYVQMLACKALEKRRSIQAVAKIFQLFPAQSTKVSQVYYDVLQNLTLVKKSFPWNGSQSAKQQCLDEWTVLLQQKKLLK